MSEWKAANMHAWKKKTRVKAKEWGAYVIAVFDNPSQITNYTCKLEMNPPPPLQLVSMGEEGNTSGCAF